MRLVAILGSMMALVAGCTTTSTSLSPYLQPDGPEVANIRFRVASLSKWAYLHLGEVQLFQFADENCGASPQGRYIDEIGKDKAFVGRANQSIGMPNPAGYPPYSYVERRFLVEKPLVFSVQVNTGGPARICQGTYEFSPKKNQMYEVTIDIVGFDDCRVNVTQIQASDSATPSSNEPVRKLLRYCGSPSLFN